MEMVVLARSTVYLFFACERYMLDVNHFSWGKFSFFKIYHFKKVDFSKKKIENGAFDFNFEEEI
jgi:hypothetical protein